jgi:hypothetical protein
MRSASVTLELERRDAQRRSHRWNVTTRFVARIVFPLIHRITNGPVASACPAAVGDNTDIATIGGRSDAIGLLDTP